MSRDGTMVFEEIERKEIIIRHIPVEQKLESQPVEPIAPELPRQSLTPFINHLVSRMQDFGDQFTASVNSATKDMIQRITVSVETGAPSNSVSTTRLKVMTAENEFLGRILEASRKIQAQRQELINEIQSLGGPSRGNLLSEIVKTESEVRTAEDCIGQMIEDHSVELTCVMRAQAAHNEMKAYLKGLRFQVEDVAK